MLKDVIDLLSAESREEEILKRLGLYHATHAPYINSDGSHGRHVTSI